MQVMGSISGSGRSSWVGSGNPLPYSCLENPMDREAWLAIVHGAPKSQTWLSDWACTWEIFSQFWRLAVWNQGISGVGSFWGSQGRICSVLFFQSQLTGKDCDAGKDWRQEEKGMTEDKMVGWHHQLNWHEFEQALADGERQGKLVCSVTKNQTWLSNEQ